MNSDISPDELLEALQAQERLQIVDVRSRLEFSAGHLPDAILMPVWKIPFDAPSSISDKSVRLVIYCEHGPRAVLARGIFKSLGYINSCCLSGHMQRWRRDGHEIRK